MKSSWRHRHAAMVPLFATQTGQTQMEVDDSMDGVRATQDVQQFTPTQEPGNVQPTGLFQSFYYEVYIPTNL